MFPLSTEEHSSAHVDAHTGRGRAGEPYEILVVDDASTDQTADVARHHGARGVSVNCRHIAGTRNAGARSGDRAIVHLCRRRYDRVSRGCACCCRRSCPGAVGGGSALKFDGVIPLFARMITPFAVVTSCFQGGTGLFPVLFAHGIFCGGRFRRGVLWRGRYCAKQCLETIPPIKIPSASDHVGAQALGRTPSWKCSTSASSYRARHACHQATPGHGTLVWRTPRGG